ncbi:MAG: MMPL family transporter [Bifidobacteriaceae bacterium]|jgi:RND superfamily putative drug exporter|nr:MMPL family transporter [Bifidobacteriaceae bacterium]
MFSRLAQAIIRHPLMCITSWVVLTALGFMLAMAGLTGEGLFDRVTSGAPRAVDSESAQADELIADAQTYSQRITLAVSGVDLDNEARATAVSVALTSTRQDLAKLPGIATNEAGIPLILDPLNPAFCADATTEQPVMCTIQMPQFQSLQAADGNGFLMTVDIARDLTKDEEAQAADAVIARLEQAARELPSEVEGVRAEVGGQTMILNELISQMKADLEFGELVALPIALLVMILVFGSFLAASMPMIGALASIGTTMGILWAFTYVFDLHTSVINVVTAVGLALSIDYGLLIVSRFREELRRQGAMRSAGEPSARGASRSSPVQKALSVTIKTAGRTVFFSALTIAVSVAGLMAFKPNILRVFGFGGLLVVLLALLTATILVPSLLALFGHRLTKPSVLTRIPGLKWVYGKLSDVASDEGAFSKLAGRVQRRPWWVLGGVVVLLVAVAWPIARTEIRNSTTELLTEDSSQKAFTVLMEEQYPLYSPGTITVITTGGQESVEALVQATEEWATAELSQIPNTSLPQVGEGDAYVVAQPGYAELALEVLDDDPEGRVARDAVAAVRAAAPDNLTVLVTGPAARLVDFEAQLREGTPLAFAIVVLAAFVLLFLMTGSVVIPLKALVTNLLSLCASIGAVTWLFQKPGHFGDLLGFTPMAGIESYILVLLLVFGFGLAMDYEVFLISRIKESYDATGDSELAVRSGLQHSGRIITSAALIIMVVFFGFAAGKLVVIKEIGLGLAVTVAIDATLVRMLLVPATMTILGKWNWWAPGPLRRLHRWAGLHH